MTFKTIDDYNAMILKDPYFEGRWSYYSKIINISKEIRPRTILEIGSNGFNLINESSTLELEKQYNADFYWDITKTPWPFDDKQFDLVIALQVWEHLGCSQREAFIELKRVSKNAILSFPYKWLVGDTNHYNITKNIINFWTLEEEYVLQRIVKNTKNLKNNKYRLINWYEF